MQSIINIKGIFLLYRGLYRVGFLAYTQLCTEKPLLQRYSISGQRPWALVTGASDGIGLGFAEHMAKRGFNVIMHGRNEQKLKEKQESLMSAYPNSEVKLLVRDMAKCSETGFFAGIKKELTGIDIAVIVNNVGVAMSSTNVIGEEGTDEIVENVVKVNTISQTMLTQLFIDQLNKRSAKSAIIDVSSICSVLSSGYIPVYSGTKIFSKYVTLGVARSGKYSNVDMLCLTPSWVTTKMIAKAKKNRFHCTVDECVEGALRALGNTNETYGSKKHTLHGLMIEFFMLNFNHIIANKLYEMVLNLVA